MKKITKQVIILSAVIIPCIAITVAAVITVYIPMFKKDDAPTLNEVSVATVSEEDKDFSVPPIIPSNHNKKIDTQSKDTATSDSQVDIDVVGSPETDTTTSNDNSAVTQEPVDTVPKVEDNKTVPTEPNVPDQEKPSAPVDNGTTKPTTPSTGGDPTSPFYKGGDNPFAGDVSNDIKETNGDEYNPGEGAKF